MTEVGWLKVRRVNPTYVRRSPSGIAKVMDGGCFAEHFDTRYCPLACQIA